MIIKVDYHWAEKLSKMPETGMGYQVVDILFYTGKTIKNVIVRNCKEYETEQKFDPNDIQKITIKK